jgi:hypothetical protein
MPFPRQPFSRGTSVASAILSETSTNDDDKHQKVEEDAYKTIKIGPYKLWALGEFRSFFLKHFRNLHR